MKIGIICAPGGHLAQAMAVSEAFADCEVFLITYKTGALKNVQLQNIKNIHFLHFYGATLFKIALNFLANIPSLIRILLKEKPDVLFSTGSEIAIPAFYMAGLFGIKRIFLETVVRTNVPTKTAKLIYPASDVFLVQWENMLELYGPKAIYAGSLL